MRLIDPAAPDDAAARESYRHGLEMTQEIARETTRPWWKIWG